MRYTIVSGWVHPPRAPGREGASADTTMVNSRPMAPFNPIVNLFGTSPVRPLQKQMAKVVECVSLPAGTILSMVFFVSLKELPS
jgi:hypothetical protein